MFYVNIDYVTAQTIYSAPWVAQYCDEGVCVSVCMSVRLSARISQEPQVPTLLLLSVHVDIL